jgi:hypothetical protein
VSIPIDNPSFELPTIPPGGQTWNDGPITDWTSSPAGLATFVETNASVGFTGGDAAQHGGFSDANSPDGYIYQDMGVPFQANMTYRVDIAGAHRSGFNHATMQFGVFSSNAIGATLGTPGFIDLQGIWTGRVPPNPDADDMFNTLRDASLLNTLDVNGDGIGSLGRRSRFDAGDTPPTGNVVVFIRHPGDGDRITFDNIRLDESPSLLRGDVNLDGDVDLDDSAVIRTNFRTAVPNRGMGDLTEDNFVDFQDYLEWKGNFPFPGAGAGASAGVPEPSSGILALAAGLFTLCGVRRRVGE